MEIDERIHLFVKSSQGNRTDEHKGDVENWRGRAFSSNVGWGEVEPLHISISIASTHSN